MKYNKIPTNAFKELQLNAGILLKDFKADDGSFQMTDILGATSGGIAFSATPTFSDYAEDIDNAPKNMKEFKNLDSWSVSMTGSFASVSADLAKTLVGAADVDDSDSTKIVPRNDLDQDDFADVWWVGDYSDENGATNGGFMAIHVLNGLSTGGFKIQSTDRAKGKFAFEFTGHYSIDSQETVPFEIYVKAGEPEA